MTDLEPAASLASLDRSDANLVHDSPSALPEPDLTPAELVARAAGLRETLREQQEQTEERGTYSPEMHDVFERSGFYRILQPRRYGGYEFDVPTYFRAMVEISRGCPSTGWCLCVATGTTLVAASHLSERAQDEVFRTGEFRCPHHAGPAGWAEPVDGGYVFSGVCDYSSGAPYATHFMSTTFTKGVTDEAPPWIIVVLVPRGQFEVLDDWRGDLNFGMRGSGSNTVVVKDVFVPKHMAVPFNWFSESYQSPGARLHGNPMYIGRAAGFYHGELAAVIVGAAWAALDEFEAIIRTRKTVMPPIVPRLEHHDYQRVYGLALGAIDSAEAILHHAGELYMQYAQARARDGVSFTMDQDMRLYGMIQNSARLAAGAVERLFANAGTGASRRGQRMQRYFRDVAMYRGHVAAQYMSTAPTFAQVHLGVPGGPVSRELPFPPSED